jgi:hypothetical protein
MFVTHRPRGANHKSKGHKGQLGGHTLSQFRPKLYGYAPKSVYKSIPCPKVCEDHEECPSDWFGGDGWQGAINTAGWPCGLRSIAVQFRPEPTQSVAARLALVPRRSGRLVGLEVMDYREPSTWPAGHVDGRPTIHHLQTDSIMSMEAPLELYIRILVVEFRTHHTLLAVLHM